MSRFILYNLIFFITHILLGCNDAYQSKSLDGKLKVVTTTGMLYDAVITVGGEQVEAYALMQPGVDPHLYKATQGDLKKLTSADLIIYNGLHLEGKMGEVFSKLGRIKSVHAVADAIPKTKLIALDNAQEIYDPHVWFDAALWKEVVTNIKLGLQQADTANALLYEANATAYLEQLDSLDLWAKEKFRSIPTDQRILITAHDAFGYMGRAYGMEVRGLQGISTLSEFGLKDVADLVNLIVARNIQAVFVETSVSPKAVKAVVEGCQKRGHHVAIGGNLYSDAMGEVGSPEGTYLGMFRANVEMIVRGLTGKINYSH